jgi:hypothetical protein
MESGPDLSGESHDWTDDRPAFLTSFRSETREKAVDTRRAKVNARRHLDSMSSTVNERNEVDAALSRAAVERM